MRRTWKEKGYTDEMVTDSYGFLDITNKEVHEIGDIIKFGLRIGHNKESLLCDPDLGQ